MFAVRTVATNLSLGEIMNEELNSILERKGHQWNPNPELTSADYSDDDGTQRELP
jgi:hypothetical protein